MDLDEAAAELYALPPEEFVARRTALARAEPAIAGALKVLGRPTLVAYAANLLAHRRPDDVAGLAALGAQMREATSSLDGPELRALSQQRRALLRALVDAAVGLTGRPFSDQARRDLEETFSAALSDDAMARQLREGRLVKGLRSDGLVSLSGGGGAEPSDEVGLRRAQRSLQDARALVTEAVSRLAEGRRVREVALAERDGAAAEVTAARRALAAAERTLARADSELDTATAAVAKAEGRVRDAECEAATAQAALDELRRR